MEKISSAQVAQLLELSAENLRALSEENVELKSKLAHFEKKDQAEKIASVMEEKGIEAEVSFEEKVAKLMGRDDLAVVSEAVQMSAPQMKIASVSGDSTVEVEGDGDGSVAASQFAANLLSM